MSDTDPLVEPHTREILEVRELVAEHDAVLLAHNYQRPEVQDAADFVGDSLGLARQAAATDAAIIVFAGVHFMAETAKILAPDRTVLLPERTAGCPMADMMSADQLREWREEYPGVPVVTYVNSTAGSKSLSDVCCTSANAVEVVRSLDADRVLCGPDRNLADWIDRNLPEVEVVPWQGFCPTHERVTEATARETKAAHPDAELLAHPECRPEVLDLADAVLSTSQMLAHAEESDAEEFIILTEGGLVHGLSKRAPAKRFFQPRPAMECPNMKLTTLESVRTALVEGVHEIDVAPDVREAARSAVERMVAIG